MGRQMPVMKGGMSVMPGMKGVIKGRKEKPGRNTATAHLLLSTSLKVGIVEGHARFLDGHEESPHRGWLIEIPSDDKGQGCSPLTTKIRKAT